jgi:hypothetical protein
MKQIFFIIIFSITIGFTISSCQHNDDVNPNHGVVELYLLELFETTDKYYFQIDETTVVIEKHPLLEYSDLIAYNSKDYTFKITKHAETKIKNLDHHIHGLAFAIKANNEMIYTGYFWPSYSSASCDWVVIDPYSIGQTNEMQVRLGYAGPGQGVTIPDKRNDPDLLEIFRRDNKLIE